MASRPHRNWPESSVAELVDMVERLTRYVRAGSVHELDGEFEDWQEAEALLRRYKPVLAQISSQAITHRS